MSEKLKFDSSHTIREIYAVILSGNLGAGKSTAAQYLAAKYDYQHLSFVKEIWKPILQERGLDNTRLNLQLLGIELMDTLGPEGIVKRLFEKANLKGRVVIDDVRRKDVVEIIRSKCRAVFLLYINANFEVRYPRLVIRDGVTSPEEQQQAEMVETETTIPELEDIADMSIGNTGDLDLFFRALDAVVAQAENKFNLT